MDGARPVLPDRIEGDGVLLRRWRVSDAEALGRAVEESHDHLRPWMAWMAQEPQSLEQRSAMLEEREREWLQGGDVMLGIFVADEVAGSCGLHRRRGPSALEIGYWIHRRLGFRLLGEFADEVSAPSELGVDCAWRMEREQWRRERRGG